jgi:hypothetical protein
MEKGHWGEYTGNAKWSRDHAHTKVTSKNYDDAVKDDAAHIDYLKRDVDYDNKHGHSDSSMTSDEKHISKLAGDMKYDKEHHGSPGKMVSPFNADEKRGGHSRRFQKGAVSKSNGKKQLPSPDEAWAQHLKQTHHQSAPAQMVSPLNEAPYFGLGPDDGKQRKINKANKTAKQIVDLQNKRSSVKNTYLGDPDDLEGEMVRTADKPASRKEARKIKKLNKTKKQLGL